MWNWKHIYIYIRESYAFLMWDKKRFQFKYFNLKGENNIFSI